jgi:hypothetical protein
MALKCSSALWIATAQRKPLLPGLIPATRNSPAPTNRHSSKDIEVDLWRFVVPPTQAESRRSSGGDGSSSSITRRVAMLPHRGAVECEHGSAGEDEEEGRSGSEDS